MTCLAATPIGFTFTTLNVPGASVTYGGFINGAGQVVGNFGDRAGWHGFLYSSGSFTILDAPRAYTTYAKGINAAGQIVGHFEDSRGLAHGFLYSGGSFSTLDVPGAIQTLAYGINDAGQVVGTFGGGKCGANGCGFVCSGGRFTTLDVPGATRDGTSANGINDAGQIAGWFENSAGFHGFLYSGGSFKTLDAPGASGATQAFGINNAGRIIGEFGGGKCRQIGCGFLYSGGSFTTLSEPGAGETSANSINNAGQIVGTFDDSKHLQHGFLATPCLTPLSARPDIIFQGRNVVGATQETVVGQPINLLAELPCTVSVRSGKWSVGGGAIGGYTSVPTGKKLVISDRNFSVLFYWYRPTRGVPYKVSYTYTLTDGSTHTIGASFFVEAAPNPRPTDVRFFEKSAGFSCSANLATCDIWCVKGGKYCSGAKGDELFMQFGRAAPAVGNYGMVVGTDTNPSESVPGKFQWVQTILKNSLTGITASGGAFGCSGAPGLDKYADGNPAYPYPVDKSRDLSVLGFLSIPFAADDYPDINLLNDQIITHSFLAQQFLMWTSRIVGSIPVPIGSVTWGFTQSSRRIPDTKFGPLGWTTPTISRPSGSGIFSTISPQYPVWDKLTTIPSC